MDKISTYLLKEVNQTISNNIAIKELQLNKNIVIISYQINEDNFKFLLSYKE